MDVTQKELAACLGITARHLRRLKEQGLFQIPENTRKYPLTKCVREYIEFKIEDETGRKASISKDKVSAEHEEIKKQISKIKLRKLRRELHEAVDVEAFLSNMLIQFRNKLLMLPPKIAVCVIGEKDINAVIKTVEKMINDVLGELSNYDPDVIDKTEPEDFGMEDEKEEEE